MKKTKKAALFLGIKLAVFALVLVLILTLLIAVRICRSNDMYPNVRDGDCVIVLRTKNVTFDDVILYSVEGEEYFGRIVAVPGETVRIENETGLWVEDSLVYNALPFHTMVTDEDAYPVVVPEDAFFVLGDLRDQSRDSRQFGCIRREQVIGKQIYLMRWRGF